MSAACIRHSFKSAYTHPASRARPLGASAAASRVRVESKQRSRSSAPRRASLRARGRGRTLFQAVHGTLAGLRTASRSASSASKSQSGAERMRTVRGGFGLWERHGAVRSLRKCLFTQQQASQNQSGRATATARWSRTALSRASRGCRKSKLRCMAAEPGLQENNGQTSGKPVCKLHVETAAQTAGDYASIE